VGAGRPPPPPPPTPPTTTSAASAGEATRGARGGRASNAAPKGYRDIPSFPPFDEAIPDDATIEAVCVFFPNHLRGHYLDAFLQWEWSGLDIFKHLTDQAVAEFAQLGINTAATSTNRANFLTKRLQTRVGELDPDETDALWNGAKVRGCMMDGRERYGRSKMRYKPARERGSPGQQPQQQPQQHQQQPQQQQQQQHQQQPTSLSSGPGGRFDDIESWRPCASTPTIAPGLELGGVILTEEDCASIVEGIDACLRDLRERA
jgi:hypothetical protein